MDERRKHILTDEDIDRIILVILQEENIDKFAEKFEERWRNYFYRGLGRGLIAWTWRGFLLVLYGLAAYGMGKDWHLWK